jgi:poly-gamma-glutamate capsule biosynthesis protein CapA/YwtB (metallophosphatase superfamily)
MFGDPAHQRQRRGGRGQQQVLPRLELQSDLDGHFGEPVEFYRVDRRGDVAFVQGHWGSAFGSWQ